mgnify:CR=1 FL=1
MVSLFKPTAGFWTGNTSGITMPKRQSRWLLTIGGVPSWVCKSVSKPSFSVGESAHRFINHTFYFPGRLEWNAVDATLVDPVDPDIAKRMIDMVRAGGYNYPTNDAEAQSIISKAGMIGALGGPVTIEQLGPVTGTASIAEGGAVDSPPAVTIEKWTLHNAWVQDVNFGSLSYDSDELVEISVKFRYDYAEFG